LRKILSASRNRKTLTSFPEEFLTGTIPAYSVIVIDHFLFDRKTEKGGDPRKTGRKNGKMYMALRPRSYRKEAYPKQNASWNRWNGEWCPQDALYPHCPILEKVY